MRRAAPGCLSVREQARLYNISKTVMGLDRAAGCPATEEEGRQWRAAHRRPYLRSVESTYQELEQPVEADPSDQEAPEQNRTTLSVDANSHPPKKRDTEQMNAKPIEANGNGQNGKTAESLDRLRGLERSLGCAAEAALAKGDVAEGLSISRQHAMVVSRLVGVEASWAKLQQRRHDLIGSEWLIRFTYAYRRPIARVIDEYLSKQDDRELRKLANELEQIVKNFCSGLEMYVNGG